MVPPLQKQAQDKESREFSLPSSFDIFVQPAAVIRQTYIMLIVEAFTLNNPECFKILFIQCFADFLPVNVALRCTDPALRRKPLVA